EANGEENRDGHNENLSWYCGVDGPTDDPAVLSLRRRQQRNFLATLLLSQGVPMLLAGDEIGRTQQGNNNTYCQDNEISWIDWSLDKDGKELLQFTRFLIRNLFHRHPVLRRRHFFQGRRIRGSEGKDLTWFRPGGKEMTEEDWNNPETRCLGLRLAGDAINEVDDWGNPIGDDTLLILMNAHYDEIPFVLPAHRPKMRWEPLLDTRDSSPWRKRPLMRGGHGYHLEGRSLALLRLRENTEASRKREALSGSRDNRGRSRLATEHP
ncbi:MAG: glycogen debranching enzyme GlgX, partial [Deltaproteobacteria bacterium]|nr:glycogen debranching enzyme GlgX [Deltaproteobacteria bacterium]